MATRRQPLIPGWLLPGLLAAMLMVVVSLGAFLALWFNAPESDLLALWRDSYLWHVIRFSFWQAFLSALLSAIPAIFLARALYRRRFPGRVVLLRLCAMTLILPVLVAVFGILSVYGRQGWLALLFARLGLEWTFSPYGLQGILLAHVFFNMPMATRLFAGTGEYSRRTTPDCRSAWHAWMVVFPLCRMALVKTSDCPGCRADLYALLRQLRHRAFSRRRATGDHH
jgi:thiamine transport system permease protein